MAALAAELEQQAALCIHARRIADRRTAERSFVKLLSLLAPRIFRMTDDYGLRDMPDDARQACAIGIHRALDSYDATVARFSTHATWQMRGELQALCHRMRPERRQGVRRAGIRLIPLVDDSSAWEVADEQALGAVQDTAAVAMAEALFDRLWNHYRDAQSQKPRARRDPQRFLANLRRDRMIMAESIALSVTHENELPTGELRRQIERKLGKNLGRATETPAFAYLANL